MAISATIISPILQRREAQWLPPAELAFLEAICDTLLPSPELPDGLDAEVAAYRRRYAADPPVVPCMAAMPTLAHRAAQYIKTTL
jgi:hypothetical protein